MIPVKWEAMPKKMRTPEVRRYYDILMRKRASLIFKRVFDVYASILLLVLLSPVFLVLAAAIKLDSKGPVFYRQVRVTALGKAFRIYKFRTMAEDADRGAQVTVRSDPRVTRVGRFIRKFRLDELSQLIDVLRGTMTFVGTRPEVGKFVDAYTPEMLATLLLPAGVTSRASIYYKDEAQLLDGASDPDSVYIERILPEKMRYNLQSLEHFGFWSDIKTMIMTVFAVLGKEYKDEGEDEEK